MFLFIALGSFVLNVLPPVNSSPALADEPPVKLSSDGQYYTLSNGYVTAQVGMRTGELWSLKYKGVETMGYVSGHHAGYWEQMPRPATPSVTIDPKTNAGERAEVSIKGWFGNFQLDERYSLGREDQGIYSYAIFTHPPPTPPAVLARAALASNSVAWSSIGFPSMPTETTRWPPATTGTTAPRST